MQFGFQKNKSTNDAIALLSRTIRSALDSSRPCAAVFIDLAKAFDTVDRRMLLSKLENTGIRGPALSLLCSYLDDRLQGVQIGNDISSYQNIEYGVPQGTVLGPILFIIYLNHLLTQKVSGILISFADDTVLCVEGDSWKEVESRIVESLQKIVNWLDVNLLTINLDKTQYLPFSNNSGGSPLNNVIHITLPFRHLNSWPISSAKYVNYLGVIIDSHIKWNYHIERVTKKIRSLLYLFKQIKNILDLNSLRMVYFALIQSHLIYGIVGWGGAYENTLKPLEITQKRIVKIMYGLNVRFSTEHLFKYSSILSVRNMYYRAALLQLIKSKSFSYPTDVTYQTRFQTNENTVLQRMQRVIG